MHPHILVGIVIGPSGKRWCPEGSSPMASATALSGSMINRQANSVSFDSKDGICRVLLHFDR